MNPIVESLYSRKSVRKYSHQEILPEIKRTILETAIQAPTAGNQVLYTILDVQTQELKEELAVLCDNQPFIGEAPLVLVFLADCQRWYDAYRYAGAPLRNPLQGDLLLACSDALIAAQNTVVAAQSFGIGSCYIGDIMEQREKIAPLLQLTDFVFPVAMVVYGYPTQQQLDRPKPKRVTVEEIVQVDRYQPMGEREIRQMLAAVSSNPQDYDFEREVQAFCKRKYLSPFAAEMNRSVAAYLKQFEG